MENKNQSFAEGGCVCGQVRYRLLDAPLFVHCCHCRWCQRESGSAFALNAIIETKNVEVLAAPPELVPTPSESGKGQTFVRCPNCKIAVWSHYAGASEKASFVRVGTLDDPDVCPPDIHIFTQSKQPWVILPSKTPAYEAYYDWRDEWPKPAQMRRAQMKD